MWSGRSSAGWPRTRPHDGWAWPVPDRPAVTHERKEGKDDATARHRGWPSPDRDNLAALRAGNTPGRPLLPHARGIRQSRPRALLAPGAGRGPARLAGFPGWLHGDRRLAGGGVLAGAEQGHSGCAGHTLGPARAGYLVAERGTFDLRRHADGTAAGDGCLAADVLRAAADQAHPGLGG